MANFDTGIKEYIVAHATVTVCFPVDWKGNADICCDQCFFFRRNYKTCGLNGEVCEYPNKFVGSCCPLTPETEENKTNTEGE